MLRSPDVILDPVPLLPDPGETGEARLTVLSGPSGVGKDAVLAAVRAVLVDGADPDPRTATLAALLSASGVLAWLDPDIPWSGAVHDRGKALEQATWGTAATAEAVRQHTVALIAGQVAASIPLATTPQ